MEAPWYKKAGNGHGTRGASFCHESRASSKIRLHLKCRRKDQGAKSSTRSASICYRRWGSERCSCIIRKTARRSSPQVNTRLPGGCFSCRRHPPQCASRWSCRLSRVAPHSNRKAATIHAQLTRTRKPSKCRTRALSHFKTPLVQAGRHVLSGQAQVTHRSSSALVPGVPPCTPGERDQEGARLCRARGPSARAICDRGNPPEARRPCRVVENPWNKRRSPKSGLKAWRWRENAPSGTYGFMTPGCAGVGGHLNYADFRPHFSAYS